MDKSVIDDLLRKCWLETTHLSIDSADHDELEDVNELYIASVVFTGSTQGSMTIAMGNTLATKVASVMFDCEVEAVSYDDIKDSIGELVNVLAGNIKSDFFGDSELSSPLVMEGNMALLAVLGTDVIFQKTYTSNDDGQLVIQLCQTD